MTDIFENITDLIAQKGNLREIPHDGIADGMTDFSSNDYLGFSRFTFPEIAEEYPQILHTPMTSSASRLLASRQKSYESFENLLEKLYGHNRKALLLNSGYHANVGIISALAAIPDTIIIADKLVHASVIDGLAGVRQRVRFPHNNLDHLERILSKSESYTQKVVVVEGVYSMDGDSPDLERLIDIKKKYPGVILYVDEAHSFGVCGPAGLGLTMRTSAPEEFDIVVATLGKALGSYGAFAITSPHIHRFLTNRVRSFIFSTSLPPMSVAWSEIMVRKMAEAENLREKLRDNAHLLHTLLAGIVTDTSVINPHPSHISYLTVGDPVKAVRLSAHLREEGILVLPIRTPTVPPGTDRLRISLSAAHTTEEIHHLASALKKWI